MITVVYKTFKNKIYNIKIKFFKENEMEIWGQKNDLNIQPVKEEFICIFLNRWWWISNHYLESTECILKGNVTILYRNSIFKVFYLKG